MEEFKSIDGTCYSISTLGRVKNDTTGRILTPWNKGKYLAVNLGFRNPFRIHNLMGNIFLTPINGYVIDHINGDKHDNRLCNLRYVTQSINLINRSYLPSNKLKEKNIRKDGNRYDVQIVRNRATVFRKHCKTLEEAIHARNNFIASE